MLNIFKCIKCENKLSLNDIEKSDIVICPNCKSEFKKIDGILTFLKDYENKKIEQTSKAFGYQWNRSEYGHNKGSKKYSSELFFSRFGLNDNELKELIENKIIYDPAIGSGRVEHIFAKYAKEIYATDLSTAIYSAKKYLKEFDKLNYFRADLINPPFLKNSFDVVICHAILQHTKDAFNGLESLVNLVKNDGIIFFDVYRKAVPIRDFGDDFIRNIVSDMPPDEAWDNLKPLTKLAQSLSKQNIEVPEDIEFLGIEKGEYNLQRFIYYKLLKLFWNDDMNFNDNHTVMFDWFYPKIANRYTSSEVKEWLDKLNLKIIRYVETEGGIGVIAKKINL